MTIIFTHGMVYMVYAMLELSFLFRNAVWLKYWIFICGSCCGQGVNQQELLGQLKLLLFKTAQQSCLEQGLHRSNFFGSRKCMENAMLPINSQKGSPSF